MDNSPAYLLTETTSLSNDTGTGADAGVDAEEGDLCQLGIEEGVLPPPESCSLRDRIGTTKLYLLADTNVGTRKRPFLKRKLVDLDETVEENGHAGDEMEMDTDEDHNHGLAHRTNALLLHGPPIAHLPTAKLFMYARHFRAEPLGLEWIDDRTCVLVFASGGRARSAYTQLRRRGNNVGEEGWEEEDSDGFVLAQPVPLEIWPVESRIGDSLGSAGGGEDGRDLRGGIQMRWATECDVKKKGARWESEFYRKHGDLAGKEVYRGEDAPPEEKRRRRMEEGKKGIGMGMGMTKEELDAELDKFLEEEEEEEEHKSEEKSKMRSDYIAADGRTVLDDGRSPTALGSRLTGRKDLSLRIEDGRRWPRGGGRGRKRWRGKKQQVNMTLQELDEQLDAFWNEA